MQALRSNSTLGRDVWVLVPVCYAVTIAIFLLTGFQFEWASSLKPMALAAGVAALYGFYAVYRPDPKICAMAESLLFLFVIAPPLAVMDYPLQSFNLDFYDPSLAKIDSAMGFDWMAHLAWVHDNPLVGQVLTIAYHSCMVQMALILIVLSLIGRTGNLKGFLSLFVCGALVVSLVSTLMPVQGAYLYHAPPASIQIGGDHLAGIWHWEHLRALRDGSMTAVSLSHVEGLITMPSFHTIFAILLIWASRGVRYLFPATFVLNVLVVISTLAVGGHYLIDVIAGASIAAVSIYVYGRLTAPRAAEDRRELVSAAA